MTTTVEKRQNRRGSQLPSDVILQLIRQGDEYNAASQDKKKAVALRFNMTPTERYQVSAIAAMFGHGTNYDPFLVSRLPLKILVAVGQKTKDLTLRQKLADLLLYAVDREWQGQEPSLCSIKPDVTLIEDVMLELERYRYSIEALHAHMRKERGMELTESDDLYFQHPAPNLRDEVYGLPPVKEARTEEPEQVATSESIITEPLIAVPTEPIDHTTQIVALAQQSVQTVIENFFQQAGLAEPQSIRARINELQCKVDALELHMQEHEAQRVFWLEKAKQVLVFAGDLQATASLMSEAADRVTAGITTLIETLQPGDLTEEDVPDLVTTEE